jgi:hypothetical protein
MKAAIALACINLASPSTGVPSFHEDRPPASIGFFESRWHHQND